jgi:hypothetical protein
MSRAKAGTSSDGGKSEGATWSPSAEKIEKNSCAGTIATRTQSQAKVSQTELDDLLRRAIQEAYRKGYAAGIIAGKRLAKGKSQFPKPHGGQKTLPDILALHFFDFVAGSKMNVAAAASSFRDALIRFGGIPEKETPSLAALMRLHQRMLTEKHKIDKSDRDVYDQLKAYYSRT